MGAYLCPAGAPTWAAATPSNSGYSRQTAPAGGCSARHPRRWSGSWEDNLKLARLCDQVGVEFLVPVGRWKGYGGVPDHNGSTFETITWATALLGATKRVQVFGTVHCPLFHPLLAAEDDGHGRSRRKRPLRPQHRRRLERGRVQDVRRRPPRSREPLRLRARVDRCRPPDVGAGRCRLRRRLLSLGGDSGEPEALRRHPPDRDERRRLADRRRPRAAQQRHVLHRRPPQSRTSGRYETRSPRPRPTRARWGAISTSSPRSS